MSCFSLEWIERLLIYLVVLCVLIGVVRLLLPIVLGWFGAPPGGGTVITILGYIMWAVVAIFCIIFVFDLISCLIGGGGTGLRLLPK
jgi:membrane protein DedA with SNARE-associated domain